MKNNAQIKNSYGEIILLICSVIVITLLHNSTMTNSSILLHEISQRLYYIPIVYSAYRFGLKGSVALALFTGLIYLIHITSHRNDSARTILNQYAEVIMFQVIGIITGFFADAERDQRKRLEKTSLELSAAYQELRGTVDLLVRAARLQTMGELATAIAHEIRNPLGAIKGAIDIVGEEIPPTSKRYSFVEIIKKESDRLTKLITEFLQYARPRATEKNYTNINQLIEAVTIFFNTQAQQKQVTIIKNLDPNIPQIMVDSEQLKQVLLNLLINALDASSPNNKIELKTLINDQNLEIQVQDFGRGIEEVNRDKVFNPFFTTKTNGTGLGLSIAQQLIRQHDGALVLANNVDKGTLFIIRLPLPDNQIDQKIISDNR